MKKIYHTLRLFLCFEGYRRAEYIRKHNLFGHMGVDCYFHPFKLPSDPKHIFIHDNVKISSDVIFINHDISNAKLNKKYNTDSFQYYLKPIEIYSNVVVGTRAMILPGRKIGENSIVGAGAVVSKDVPAGSVVVGNPIRVVKYFDSFVQERKDYDQQK